MVLIMILVSGSGSGSGSDENRQTGDFVPKTIFIDSVRTLSAAVVLLSGQSVPSPGSGDPTASTRWDVVMQTPLSPDLHTHSQQHTHTHTAAVTAPSWRSWRSSSSSSWPFASCWSQKQVEAGSRRVELTRTQAELRLLVGLIE